MDAQCRSPAMMLGKTQQRQRGKNLSAASFIPTMMSAVTFPLSGSPAPSETSLTPSCPAPLLPPPLPLSDKLFGKRLLQARHYIMSRKSWLKMVPTENCDILMTFPGEPEQLLLGGDAACPACPTPPPPACEKCVLTWPRRGLLFCGPEWV